MPMPLRILVVDDASFIRDMVKKQLRDRLPGVEVYDATDGNRALAVMKNQTMDLVLSDWEMPNMSGEELLRAIRANAQTAAVPFIMVSSRGDRSHVIKAVEAGVSDYLSKPFTADELLRKVAKQLKLATKEPSPARGAGATQGIAFASVDVLTGGRRGETGNVAKAPSSEIPGRSIPKARAQLRFADNLTCPCVIRDLSLQALSGLIQRTDRLPGLLEQAVVDIEMGEGGELARVNGYVHSLQAGDNRPDAQVIKIAIRFVDNDAEKFSVLSQYIAQL